MIRVGQHDTSLQEPHAKNYDALKVIIHEHYKAATFENDIALIQLKESIQFNEHVAAIALPASGYVPADGSVVSSEKSITSLYLSCSVCVSLARLW